MCDYSITAQRTRPAVVGDKLTIHYLGASKGFVPTEAAKSLAHGDELCAVCLRPGTEISFDEPVCYCDYMRHQPIVRSGHTTAIFRQVDLENDLTHHDALEFPDGTIAKVAHLDANQHATVLQLPAEAKDALEALHQEVEKLMQETKEYLEEARIEEEKFGPNPALVIGH